MYDIRKVGGARLLGGACAAWVLAAGTPARAEPFEGGRVTIVVSGRAGSSFDNAARLVAEPLAKEWGVPVVVDNRTGASGIIGAAYVAKSAPDGRTLLLGTTPAVQAPQLLQSAGYDPVSSFAPVAQLFNAQLWLGVNAGLPAKTVKEFVAHAAQPGSKLAFSSPGQGSTPHLNTVILMKQTGIDMLHVPFTGIPPAVMEVAAGRVASVFASYSDLLPHAQSGAMRILASTGSARSPISPDIPTMKESGYTGFEVVGFGGLLAPAGTPPELTARMAASVQKVLARPEIRKRLLELGFEPVDSNQEAFAALIRAQNDFWAKVIRDAGIKVE
ncbi:MAG: tripartite tricarboxylate transporter substrate binding protein [Pigmentiphaga sp.]|uniref:Bug family tripartite tricarboxylate transporter substrate binding protein n=1 Tax=Pigmentiphaga sp. TaxID=1977564 RepID=UPI0029A761B7|nr:tripartite tricarboxylate transporter substrate binding protein [Pigmentiphaga sp.]MDX3906106.1 tripartite tricarboxylate transporter substrate binding protein [Pigmentiphaga sp.]